MSRIHVICAPPPGMNAGMATVELAFRGLARRHGLLDRTRFLYLYPPRDFLATRKVDADDVLARMRLPMEHDTLLGALDSTDDGGPIVYWGDFFQACDYHADLATILQRLGHAPDARAALDLARRHMLLSDSPDERVARTILYGGTLIFNRPRDVADPAYGEPLARLLRGAHTVLFRDVYSALFAARTRGDPITLRLGTDCAMLLHDEDLADLPTGPWSAGELGRGDVGVFFGRSAVPPKLLGTFAKEIAEALGADGLWLPWGAAAFEVSGAAVRKGFRGLRTGPDARPTTGDVVRVLRRFRTVVTDTYHVSVNAWRGGIPPICVIPSTSDLDRDISAGHLMAWRDKRRVMFSMLDAMELLVDASELEDKTRRRRRVARLAEIVADPSAWAPMAERLRQQAAAAETALVAAIGEIAPS